MSSTIKVSWNDQAHFQLTEEGTAYVRAYFTSLFGVMRDGDARGKLIEESVAQIRQGRIPLWEMALIFGQELSMGGRAPMFFVDGTQFELERSIT